MQKYTDEQIRQIKKMYFDTKLGQAEIAKQLNVNPHTVAYYVHRENARRRKSTAIARAAKGTVAAMRLTAKATTPVEILSIDLVRGQGLTLALDTAATVRVSDKRVTIERSV